MRSPEFSDQQLLAAIAAAAAELGEPLTATAYDAWQRGRDDAASPALVIRRLGSWTSACQRAGVATNKTRSTSSRWTDEEMVGFVGEYLRSGATGSFAGYAAWAKEQDGAPSGAVLRQRFPSWSELKERARR